MIENSEIRYYAIANEFAKVFGLTTNNKYIIGQKSGLTMVYNLNGEYLTFARTDVFNHYELIN